MINNWKKYLLVAVLGLAAGSIFFLPYIKYVFYDAHIASMGITNIQSGYLMTIYTLANMILYIPGGILADRISPKKALVYSCLGTSALSIVYLFTMNNFTLSMVIWAGLALTTGFVIWAALLKTIRIIGSEKEQAFLYGFYYACNGVACAVINIVAVLIYKTGPDMQSGYFRACAFGAVIPVIVAIVLLVLLKDEDGQVDTGAGEPKFRIQDMRTLAMNPTVWLIAIVTLIGYGYYSSISYFTPYLTDVKGVSVADSGILSAIRTYLLLLLAPLGGLLADRVFKSTSKWLITAFFLLSVLFGTVLILPADISSTAASIYTLIVGAIVMMTYGVISSVVAEAGIPKAMTGTAIGIISMVAYLPDSIYSLLFGKWLDQYQSTGYNLIFGFLACSGLLGAILSFVILQQVKKKKAGSESNTEHLRIQ